MARTSAQKHGDVAEQPPPERMALSVTEAAWVLGVAPWTIRGMIRRGELRAVRLGRRGGVIRVRRDEITEYLARLEAVDDADDAAQS